MTGENCVIIRVVFTLLGAFLFDIGRIVYADNSIQRMWQKPGEFLIYYLAAAVLIYLLLMVVDAVGQRLEAPSHEVEDAAKVGGEQAQKQSNERWKVPNDYHRLILAITMLLLAASFALAYLVYFPGIFGYDIDQQTWQITGSVPWNNHHPVLHTLIWKAFYDLEKATGVRYIALVGYSVV